MNCIQQIQPYLRSKESCKCCIEGCLVSGWTRLPHFFAIVCSATVNNYGLLIFSHPGIGSKDTTIHPKYALPIDVNFEYLQIQSPASNPFNSEIQVELRSGSIKHLAEFVIGPTTEQFITVLTELCTAPSKTLNSSFEWLNKYNKCTSSSISRNTNSGESTEDWPWSEITQLQSNTSATPVAYDADDQVKTLDPLGPNVVSEDLLGDYENIENTFQICNLSKIDLKDFDPLSNEEIETGIKTDKMISSGSLQRSSPSVSNKVINSTETGKLNLYSDNDAFDIVESEEVQSAAAQDSTSNLYSTFFTAGKSVSRARDNFIKLHMAAREKDFTDLFPYSIFIGTWNVNGQLPSESLVPWLREPSDSLLSSPQNSKDPPDIFAIGFQELDLSAEAFVFNDSSREDQWIQCIELALPQAGDYFKIKHVRLVGMMLVVYAHGKHKGHIEDVESETHGTGIMGMMGNKGGVSIRFQMYHTNVCFVNSHLAAHLSEFERRNQDFNDVYNNLKFTLFQPPLSISGHDMVFWLGDLNYRFDELGVEEVKRMSDTGDYKSLYLYDQLNKQKNSGKVFKDFSESQPTFKPTYKFDPGTNDWDTSEKARAPAWCDRVLWKGKHIEQLSYGCHPDMKLSDHKPVSSLFNVNIKIVNKTRERKVFEEIVRKLDKEENESLPQVKLEKQEISFGDVDFMEKKIRYLPIANIGQRIVEFQFIPKLDEKAVCMPWFKINPIAGYIMPGDFKEIELTLCVDKISAPQVTQSKFQVNDILVLHLVNGKDFFVPLSAEYKPSVFGVSLETLVRTYGAIKDVPVDSLIQQESSDTFEFPDLMDVLEIPKELWLLIDHLHKFGMTKENILLQAGIDEEIIQIRTYLDTGEHEGKIPGSIYSVGNALLLFLEALCEPVIPMKYHSKCLEACNNFILCKQVVNNLPVSHFNVFRYVCAFLRELLKQCGENKLDAKILATVFGSIFLRSPQKDLDNLSKRIQSQLAQKKSKFVFQFLINDFNS